MGKGFKIVTPLYTVTVYPESDSDYVSELYAGLSDLQGAGIVKLCFRRCPAHRVRPINHQGILWLEVEMAGADRRMNVCFDTFDWQDIASMHDLEAADIYFKRSYHVPYIDQLTENLREKVVPMGLHYACSSRDETLLTCFRRSWAHNTSRRVFTQNPNKAVVRSFATPAKTLLKRHGYGRFESLPLFMDEFEVQPHEPTEPKVFYRTRVYGPDDAPDTFRLGRTDEINGMRADTIRALRRHFGDRFVGGLRPSTFAERNYPDCMFPDDAGLKGHVQLSKSCLINVSTAGLHDSTSWKIPEYMAASRCIVSEPLKYQASIPLVERQHFLPFRTPEECVRACEELLDDSTMAIAMRNANFRYYIENVRPAQLMLKALQVVATRCLSKQTRVLKEVR